MADEPRKIRQNFDSVVDSSNGDQTMAVVNLPFKKRRLFSDEANNVQSVVVRDDAKITPEKIADGGTPSAIDGEILEAAKLQIDRNPEMKATDDTSIIILEQLLNMKNIIANYTKHTQANDSGPGSRYFTVEDKCLSKELRSSDWCSLHIDYFDALILTDDPDIGLCSPGSFKRKNTMTVFDGANRKYTMVLSMHKITGRKMEYFTLGGDWEKFVVANKLKIGDEVTMYHLDRDEKSYVVKYFRKPADRFVLENVTNMKKIGAAYEEENREAKKITSAAPSNPLEPAGSRYFAIEDKCLLKKLTSVDRCSLHIDYFDALILTNDPDIGLCSPSSFKRKNTMTVFDGANRKYTMVLSMHKITGRKMEYFTLGGEWEKFIVANKLKPGDEVTMYHLDRKKRSYVFKYFRKPADRFVLETGTNMKKIGAAYEEENHEAKKITSAAPSNPLEPAGSRNYQTEEPTLSKKLSSFDVIKQNAVLNLDYYEAVLLTDDHDMNHENKILVYDEAEIKYYMVVSKREKSGGRVRYELGGDWKYFVGAHDLKAGDEVLFHEIDEEDSIGDENRFVLRYNRKPN